MPKTCISIELRLLASTVNELLSLTDSNDAEIFVVPRFLAVTRPLTVTVAMEVEPELQVDTLVTSCVVPSENVAITVNCLLRPSARVAGPVIDNDVALADVTVNTAVSEVIEPEVAVMLVVPAPTPNANPLVGVVSLMVATAVFEELQLTLPVISWLLVPSLYVPNATNCCLVDFAIVLLAGVIAMETSFGAMVTLAEPLTPPMAAVTDTAPAACAVSTPPALTEAKPAGDAVQVTDEVRSLVLPSPYLPVAVS